MAKHYLLFILAFGFMGYGQTVNIPDAVFKARLIQAAVTNEIALDANQSSIKIDANNDGEIQESEALLVYYLNVSSPLSSQPKINNLDGIASFTNLKSLDCSTNYLTSLNVTALSSLVSLSCNSNHLLYLTVNGLGNMKNLICGDNNIITLDVSGLTGLEKLACNGNHLSSLDLAAIPNLTSLLCGDNYFNSLNVAPLVNLKTLSCEDNYIQVLDLAQLTSLEYLSCSYNNIHVLDVTPLTSLKTLLCGNNDLDVLNVTTLTQLEMLSCFENYLSTLNISNCVNLKTLYCYENELQSLDMSGLPYLTYVDCSGNSMAAINLSQAPGLNFLGCKGNLFTTLDLSPLNNLWGLSYGNEGLAPVDLSSLASLSSLDVYYLDNDSLILPYLPGLTSFSASENDLTAIDLSQLPNLYYMNISYNYNLISVNIKTGTPFIQNNGTDLLEGNSALKYVCANESDITPVLQIINDPDNAVQVNSYCNFTPGGDYNTITGTTHFNAAGNSCSATDPVFNNVGVAINDGSNAGKTFTFGNGTYKYFVQQPNITLAPSIENPSFFNITPATVAFNFPANENIVQVQDFCITPVGVHPDLEVMLVPEDVARPGFDTAYKIVYRNKGNQTQSGTVTMTFDDAVVDFLLATPTAVETANLLTWDFTNLLPFEKREILLSFNLNTPTETPALNGGDYLDYSVAVTIAPLEETPLDNVFSYHQPVVNSFDPNDKTCLEGNTITPEMAGKYVHYLIRFENTGTYPAQNIVVKDIIDTNKFDISTLVPLSGSHLYTTRITDGNRVEFIFENINLPFEDANNDGYVLFKIKTKSTLVTGNSFSNTASIYFDYNAPIVTNTATTTLSNLGNPDFVFDNYFTLYPNPAKDVLNIKAKEDLNITSVSIYNTLGQLVLVVPNANGIETIDVSNLTTGNYFIKVISDKGSSNARFVKE